MRTPPCRPDALIVILIIVVYVCRLSIVGLCDVPTTPCSRGRHRGLLFFRAFIIDIAAIRAAVRHRDIALVCFNLQEEEGIRW